jgi:hypothetical protein
MRRTRPLLPAHVLVEIAVVSAAIVWGLHAFGVL